MWGTGSGPTSATDFASCRAARPHSWDRGRWLWPHTWQLRMCYQKTVNGVAVEDLSKTVDAIPPVLKITWYVLTGCETLYSGLILQPFYQKLVLMRSDRP